MVNIGRADYNDIVIVEPSVSTTHAKLQRRDDVWVVTDPGSTNGTYVEGEPVTGETALTPGTTLKFGETAVLFEPLDERPVPRPAETGVMGRVGAPLRASAPKPSGPPGWLIAMLTLGGAIAAYFFLTSSRRGQHALHLCRPHRRRHRQVGQRDNYLMLSERGIFMVADGMGGHAAGEVASEMAVRITSHAIGSLRGLSDEEASGRMRTAIRAANDAIFERTLSEHDKRGMGTTATVLVLLKGRYLIGQVGDSRAYLLRDGQFLQLTKDHSYVQEQGTGRGLRRVPRPTREVRSVDLATG